MAYLAHLCPPHHRPYQVLLLSPKKELNSFLTRIAGSDLVLPGARVVCLQLRSHSVTFQCSPSPSGLRSHSSLRQRAAPDSHPHLALPCSSAHHPTHSVLLQNHPGFLTYRTILLYSLGTSFPNVSAQGIHMHLLGLSTDTPRKISGYLRREVRVDFPISFFKRCLFIYF